MFCDNCWSIPKKHQQPESGHDKTVPNDAIIVHLTLKVRLNEWSLLEDAMKQLQAPEPLGLVGGSSEWFGVWPKNEAGDCLLTEGPAYEFMMDSFWKSTSGIYPGLVSFIGETGSGKSTLIGLLSQFSKSQFKSLFKTPVVGDSVSNQSTSSNVHLYADPETFFDENPILYADCEGMDGDEVPTEMKKTLANAEDSGDPLPHASQASGLDSQDIVWEKKPGNGSVWTRKEITKTLFPRILYIFSDVVVFIPFNKIRLEDTLFQLVQWGHGATVKSYNKPVLPSAIIAFINKDDQVDPGDYDLETAMRSVFEKPGFKDVSRDRRLEMYIQYWKANGQDIVSAEDLLSCYYSSVSVVHFPSGNRPTMMRQQVEKLYEKINEVCLESQGRRQAAWMKWNAATLPLFVRKAFTHFATNYETPFNFSDAWVDLEHISFNFNGSIFNLARMVERHRGLAGMDLWRGISGFVASCVFLNCVRTKQPDCIPAEKLWKQCDEATDRYWMKFWPCEYGIERGEEFRCVNAPSGHPHHQVGQDVKGGDKNHIASHQRHQLRKEFRRLVEKALGRLKSKLESHSNHHERLKKASTIHLKQTKDFYKSIKNINEFVSHLTCLVCLDGVPEHSLPCGHVICRVCAKAAGESTPGGFVTLQGCPLWDHQEEHWSQQWAGYIKPSQAGLRILSLDGGGIKGIVELEILSRLQKHLGPVPVRDCFDLIVGTSTGGIIACALGPGALDVKQCNDEFINVSTKAFTRPKESRLPGLIGTTRDAITAFHNQGLYRSSALEDALKEGLPELSLFGGTFKFKSPSVKTAVTTSTSQGKVIVLGNYNRNAPERAFYELQMSRPGREIQLWEAARATSAAPFYFPPFSHEGTKQVYLDGGLWHNNPIRIADSEAKAIWPDTKHTHPDMILSIGTGYHETELNESNGTQAYLERVINESIPEAPGGSKRKSKRDLVYGVMEIGLSQFIRSLNSERIWHEWLQARAPSAGFESRYRRLNVEFSQIVSMDNPSDTAIKACRDAAKGIPEDTFESVADQLIASCFFFRVDKESMRTDSKGSYEFCGAIECRLQPESVKLLGEHLETLPMQPYFILKETHEKTAESIPIDDNILKTMKDEGSFRMTGDLRVSSELAETEIFLNMRDTKKSGFHISGLPRRIKDDEDDGRSSFFDRLRLGSSDPFLILGVYSCADRRQNRDLRIGNVVRFLLDHAFKKKKSHNYSNEGGTLSRKGTLQFERKKALWVGSSREQSGVIEVE
ncbi:Fc.00g036010.m01.CDS01 [Cosmosporella sp. VM-42]